MPRSQFPKGTKAVDVVAGIDLTDKTYFITGANTGIGFEAARALALQNAHVVMGCRSLERARIAANSIKTEKPSAEVDIIEVDNGSLQSVRECAKKYKEMNWPLHCLILNAGVVSPPNPKTEDGYETTFQVNHLAHFYLTKLLEDVLIRSAPSRVVVVSGDAHRKCHDFDTTVDKLSPAVNTSSGSASVYAYCNSKLCNILFANELDQRLKLKGVRANSLHPGVVHTEIGRSSYLTKCIMCCIYPATIQPEAGAATTVYLAANKDIDDVGGKYYIFCEKKPASAKARDMQLAKKLWDTSEQLVLDFENHQ